MKKLLAVLMVMSLFVVNCNDFGRNGTPRSSSGVAKATVHIQTNEKGLTIEQENVGERLKLDNTPGSIKHLCILSAYTGDVLIYSTVKGKVTSSGKRLTPTSISGNLDGNDTCTSGFGITIDGNRYCTPEVLQDDGTYGSSIEYLFWWDTQGRYHQHYKEGGQIIHISDQPLPIKKVKIRLDIEGNHAAPEAEIQ